MGTKCNHYIKEILQSVFGFLFIACFSTVFVCQAQSVDFQSSNLPIIMIDTNSQLIPDEPKITAHLGIIDNGDGSRNYLTDAFNDYDGFIGIETRGNSSQTWPKKAYGIETRDAQGENNNVSIFGMPKENDWILYAPYADKTLIRNVLVYNLATEMGWYAPRTRFCELVLNGDYMGVYVFLEKIKRDKNRVDIPKPDSSDLSGGYLLEMIVNDELKDPVHFTMQQSGKMMVVQYPKPEDISNERLNWISEYFNEFENVLNSENFADPEDGYAKYINVPSFLDHMLLSEAFNQLDAYSQSMFFYKDVKGKLISGPVWDFNRCIGNACFYTSWQTTGWWLKRPLSDDPTSWYRINWPARLMEDPEFMKAYSERWFELRNGLFSFDSLFAVIDDWAGLLREARIRNFQRWPVLGVSINNKYTFDTYEEEIQYMKDWIVAKFTWMDDRFNNPEYFVTDSFVIESLEPQTGQFEMQWNAYATADFVDGVIGFSQTSPKAYSDLSAKILFNNKGQIQVNNGSSFTSDMTVNYTANQSFAFKMVVDMDAQAYSVWVTPQGEDEILLADEYAFHPEPGEINSINYRSVKMSFDSQWGGAEGMVEILDFNVVTGLKDKDGKNQIPLNYSIKNYPNPFNPSTTIQFEIPRASFVRIEIFNVSGQIIRTLTEENYQPGVYSINWNGNDQRNRKMASGLYFYQLKVNGFVKTKKMLLIE